MFKAINRIIAVAVIFCLIFEQSGFAQVAPQMPIPAYINGYVAPDRFRPVQLRSISFDSIKQDFALYLDKGDESNAKPSQLSDAGRSLMKYFEIGLAMPNSYFWVNLRPDAPDQIIDPNLGNTDIGRVLLEADLQLKKDMARFTSPNTKEGRDYWNKLYVKAEQLFGQDDISVPTVTRPWIVPGEILVRESNSSAYIMKATLKVMLEQDYLVDAKTSFSDSRIKELNQYSSDIIRSVILPKLTREVNSSKKYAGMRQAYYSLILAQWFKAHYRGTNARYASRIDNKVLEGLTSQQAWSKDTYFKAYKKSFEQGEYNISETVSAAGGLTVRQYFSGGADFSGLKVGGIMDGGLLEDDAVRGLQKGLVAEMSNGVIIDDGQSNTTQGSGGIFEARREFIEKAKQLSTEQKEWLRAGNVATWATMPAAAVLIFAGLFINIPFLSAAGLVMMVGGSLTTYFTVTQGNRAALELFDMSIKQIKKESYYLTPKDEIIKIDGGRFKLQARPLTLEPIVITTSTIDKKFTSKNDIRPLVTGKSTKDAVSGYVLAYDPAQSAQWHIGEIFRLKRGDFNAVESQQIRALGLDPVLYQTGKAQLPVILYIPEALPNNTYILDKVNGMVAQKGGWTSFGQLYVRRDNPIPAVTDTGEIIYNGRPLRTGDGLTVDANTGNIFAYNRDQQIPIIEEKETIIPYIDGGSDNSVNEEMKKHYEVLRKTLEDPPSVSAADEGGGNTIGEYYIGKLQKAIEQEFPSREKFDEFMVYLDTRLTQAEKRWTWVLYGTIAAGFVAMLGVIMSPALAISATIGVGYGILSIGGLAVLYLSQVSPLENVSWKAGIVGELNILQFKGSAGESEAKDGGSFALDEDTQRGFDLMKRKGYDQRSATNLRKASGTSAKFAARAETMPAINKGKDGGVKNAVRRLAGWALGLGAIPGSIMVLAVLGPLNFPVAAFIAGAWLTGFIFLAKDISNLMFGPPSQPPANARDAGWRFWNNMTAISIVGGISAATGFFAQAIEASNALWIVPAILFFGGSIYFSELSVKKMKEFTPSMDGGSSKTATNIPRDFYEGKKMIFSVNFNRLHPDSVASMRESFRLINNKEVMIWDLDGFEYDEIVLIADGDLYLIVWNAPGIYTLTDSKTGKQYVSGPLKDGGRIDPNGTVYKIMKNTAVATMAMAALGLVVLPFAPVLWATAVIATAMIALTGQAAYYGALFAAEIYRGLKFIQGLLENFHEYGAVPASTLKSDKKDGGYDEKIKSKEALINEVNRRIAESEKYGWKLEAMKWKSFLNNQEQELAEIKELKANEIKVTWLNGRVEKWKQYGISKKSLTLLRMFGDNPIIEIQGPSEEVLKPWYGFQKNNPVTGMYLERAKLDGLQGDVPNAQEVFYGKIKKPGSEMRVAVLVHVDELVELDGGLLSLRQERELLEKTKAQIAHDPSMSLFQQRVAMEQVEHAVRNNGNVRDELANVGVLSVSQTNNVAKIVKGLRDGGDMLSESDYMKLDPGIELRWLEDQLETGDHDQRIEAIKALASVNDENAVYALAGELKAYSTLIRRLAIQGLGERGDRTVLPSLIGALGSEFAGRSIRNDKRVVRTRIKLVRTVGLLGRQDAVDVLIKTLETDPSDFVRAYAAYELGRISDERGRDALLEIQYNNNESYFLRRVVANVLIRERKHFVMNVETSKIPDDGGAPGRTGGIDFRALPVVSQPVVRPDVIAQKLEGMPMVSADEMDKSWASIQTTMAQGQMPYTELKQFVIRCYAQKNDDKYRKAATQCVLNILKLEEERAISTSDELKQIVILL